jgi:NitT/TauT family transport system substrate-binding protein
VTALHAAIGENFMPQQIAIVALARHLLAAAIIFAFGQMAAAQTSMKMVLDWNFEAQHSPYALAADAGIFAKHGLSVTVDRGFGSGDTVTKVAAGAYDIGIADMGAIIAFNAKQGGNKLITIFQLYDQAPLAVMTLNGNGITKPTDLNGKKVASPPGDSSRVMFPVFAKANNVDLTSIKWTDVTPPLRAALLLKKEVDAITAQTSEVISFRNLGVKDGDLIVLRYGDYGVKLYGHAIVTTPEYAAAHKPQLTAFLKAVVEAWDATIKNPQASIAVIRKRNGLINEAVEMDRFKLMLDEVIATPNVIKDGFSQVDPERLKFTIEAVTSSFGLPGRITPQELYHPEFLPPKAELAYPK